MISPLLDPSPSLTKLPLHHLGRFKFALNGNPGRGKRNSAPFGELLNFELFNQQSRIGLFNDQLNLEFVNDRRNLAPVPDPVLDWAISPAQF